MAIFSSAIKTLSELCLLESGKDFPKTTSINVADQIKEELNNLPLLSEQESVFTVSMVPVRESKRLGKYLIEMEDLSRYMITNRIQSARDAVGNILKENGLTGEYHKVALVVDEASILDEIAELGLGSDDESQYSQTGLGTTAWGKQENLTHYRKLANTKQMLDVFVNRYGMPIVKKNYSIGLPIGEAVEDAKMKVEPNDQVIHEKPEDEDLDDDKLMKDIVDDNDDIEDDDDKSRYEEVEDEDLEESAYQKRLQWMRDVSSGKLDNELF